MGKAGEHYCFCHSFWAYFMLIMSVLLGEYHTHAKSKLCTCEKLCSFAH